MFVPHKDLVLPAATASLWRYMDLTKLLAILSNRSLYFSHVTKFDDKHEGHVPLLPVEEQERRFLIHYDDRDAAIRGEMAKASAKAQHKYDSTRESLARQCLYVNCWHRNEVQSDAMWKLYLSTNEGVAIRSSVERLQKCFISDRQVFLGQVRYVDFANPPMGPKLPPVPYPPPGGKVYTVMRHSCGHFSVTPPPITDDSLIPFGLQKRPSFSHEQELRAIFFDAENKQKSLADVDAGHDIAIDPEILIESIYLSPTCPTWIKPVVESVLGKYYPSLKVIPSNLNDAPLR